MLRNALMVSAENGYIEVVTALIAKGANVDARTEEEGRTALMSAAEKGRSDIARILLEHGANRAAKNKKGKTAADLAKASGYDKLAATILTARRNQPSAD